MSDWTLLVIERLLKNRDDGVISDEECDRLIQEEIDASNKESSNG